jgi:hypothetical protein
MTTRKWIEAIVGSLVLVIPAAPGRAGPIGNSAIAFMATGAESSLVERVDTRRCWQRNGERHCNWYEGSRAYRDRNGGGNYYEHDSNNLPVGSQRWWDQMLRENRLNPGGGRG